MTSTRVAAAPATAGAFKAGSARHDRRWRLGLMLSFALLGLGGIAAAVLAYQARQAQAWVEHTLQVRHLNAELLSAVLAAETAGRGYFITGDPRYRDRFNAAQERIADWQSKLGELTLDDAEQQARLAELRAALVAKAAQLGDTVALMERDPEAAAAAILAHLDDDLGGQVHRLSSAIDQAERQLLSARTARAARTRSWLLAATMLCLFSAAALALLAAQRLRAHAERAEDANLQLATAIRERERVEGQLRQAQKMEALGRLTGGVAHDFNNMLAVIVGSLDIVLRHLPERDARARRMTENALEAARRAAALTHRLLAFSRLQPLAPKPTDVNRCVRDIAEMLRRTLGEQIQVEVVLSGGGWMANIDRPQLESAILNLAVNARDAMPGGGKLTIETANTYLDANYADRYGEIAPGQYVMIGITDSGNGMPPEVLSQAFEPFFTTKPAGTGTGLGLSQVHGFIKQSGGHIAIYSEVGVGTTVKLYLPRHVGAAPEEEATPAPSVARDNRNIRILLVEDEDGVRQFVSEALAELGYQVTQARSAESALALLGAGMEVDLLLTDVVMPEMNGRQLVDAALRRHPGLRVLYMTGYTRNAIIHNGVLDPGTRLLTKPFTLAQLDTEVRAALATAAA